MYSKPIGNIKLFSYEELLEDVEKEFGSLEKADGETLIKLAEIKAECEDLKDRFGILHYAPQEYQEAFHKCLDKVRFIFGGNQTGKTECSCADGIMISLGIHPHIKIPVPNRGRVIATDISKGIGEVIGVKYNKLIPMEMVEKIVKYPGHEYKKIFYKNGSTVEFLSYEQDVKVFEGWTGHWAQFDEPPPRPIYVATYRGLMRYEGIMWGAMTPLDEPWIYDEIFLKASKDPNTPSVFIFDIYQNKYLPLEQIKKFEENIPEDEKEARLHGQFKHLKGLIYKSFGMEHRIPSFEIPKDWTRYCAMDYHPRTPCSMLWVAIDPHGTAYVYDELWIDKTLSGLVEAIIVKETEHGVLPARRKIDNLSSTPERGTGRSSVNQIWHLSKELGCPLVFRGSNKNWVLGKHSVDKYLQVKNGVPGIYFFEDKVPKCIKAMQHYQWDEYAGVKSEKRGKKETPAAQYAHFPDTLRYILVDNPKYRRKIPLEFRDLEENHGNEVTGYNYGG